MINEDVMVSITGSNQAMTGQNAIEEGPDDDIEVIATGKYYERNNKSYILFDEYMEQQMVDAETTKCMIKLDQNVVELSKRGPSNQTHMIFEEGQFHMANYQTLFGPIMIGVHTKSITKQRTDNTLNLEIQYSLEMDCNAISENTVKIQVQSR